MMENRREASLASSLMRLYEFFLLHVAGFIDDRCINTVRNFTMYVYNMQVL